MTRRLVLVPTAGELRLLERAGLDADAARLCGFGPATAAARTALLIRESQPDEVLLLGIAGSFDEALFPPGSALEFGSVAMDSRTAPEASRPAAGCPPAAPANEDPLPLGAPGPLLLTVAVPSHFLRGGDRRARFPDAIGEDMEGYSVAKAAWAAQVPVRIIRGASNRTGDGDRSRWLIEAALAAVLEKARLPSGSGL